MDMADLTALTGLLYLLLAIKQQPWCWPVGIVSVSMWFWLAFEGRLYMDAGLQLIYIVLGFYGWYQWLRGADGSALAVRRIKASELKGLLALMAIASLGFGLLSAYILKADYPWVDSVTTVICLAAQYLTARKVLESWMFWIIGDGVYIWLYAEKGWSTLSLLMVAYTILAFVGFYKWQQDEKKSSPAKTDHEAAEALCLSRG